MGRPGQGTFRHGAQLPRRGPKMTARPSGAAGATVVLDSMPFEDARARPRRGLPAAPHTLLLVVLGTALLLTAASGTASASHYNHLLAPLTTCGGSKQNGPTVDTATQERLMRCMHNYARRKVGKPNLAENAKLMTSAGRKATDVLNCSSAQLSSNAHECGPGDSFYRVRQAGYCYRAAGENVAWGWGRPEVYAPSVRSTMSGWLHSDPHRLNLLGQTSVSRLFTEIGIGLAKGVTSTGTHKRGWAVHFGRPKAC
jgi:uncharacterized protein YkwD